MSKRITKTILHNALICLLCVIWIIPIVWLVCTSFSAYPGMNTSTISSRRNGAPSTMPSC